MAKSKEAKKTEIEQIVEDAISDEQPEEPESNQDPVSEGKPQEPEDKPNITTVQDVRGTRQYPRTGQHKYARGFGYNPE